MSRRAAAWLAWSLASFTLLTAVASVALEILAPAAQEAVPSSFVLSRTVIDLLVGVPFLAFPLVGALGTSR